MEVKVTRVKDHYLHDGTLPNMDDRSDRRRPVVSSRDTHANQQLIACKKYDTLTYLVPGSLRGARMNPIPSIHLYQASFGGWEMK